MEDIFIGLIIAIVVIVVVIYGIFKKKQLKEKEKNKIDKLNNLNITETKNMKGDGYSIVVDDENHKFAIMTDDMNDYDIYNYEDFVECQVIENDGENSQTSGNAGKVILGTMFLGGIGALAGMAGGRKTRTIKIVNSLSLRILVKNIKTPFYQIDFIDRQCKTDSEIYDDAIKEIGEIVATFNLIKTQNKK